MHFSNVFNTFSVLLLLPLFGHAVAVDEDFDIFYGLPGRAYGYGTMGAAQNTLNALEPDFLKAQPTGVLAHTPLGERLPGDSGDWVPPGDSPQQSPQEYVCPQDNGAKFSIACDLDTSVAKERQRCIFYSWTDNSALTTGRSIHHWASSDIDKCSNDAQPAEVTEMIAPMVAASAPGDEVFIGMTSVAAASGASSRYPQEFYCPQDNGQRFSTGGKCFELRCNTGTNLNVGVAQEFPSTSLRECAEACGRTSDCMACDIHLPAERNPNKCLLFRGTPANGKLRSDRNIHYWVMLNMNQCGSTYDDHDRDRDRDRYPGDRECAIDRQVVQRAEDDCYRQYGRARSTPLFDSRGRPACCGPVKSYDRDGRLAETCPPSRNDYRDDNGRYDDGNYDDGVGAQNTGSGGGAERQREN